MRASQWLLGLATMGTVFGAVAAGCGGSSSSGGGGTDSGAADVTAEKAVEAAAEAAAEASPETGSDACVFDGSLTNLNIPDAAIGDSGASTDECYACIQSTCGSQLASCGADCACATAVEGFLSCVASGTSPTTCGTGLATSGNTTALVLGICVAGSAAPGGSGPGCLHQCGVTIPEGGATEGGGGEGGGEGGTEAGGD